MPLVRGLAVPLHPLGLVLRDADSLLMALCHQILSKSIPGLSARPPELKLLGHPLLQEGRPVFWRRPEVLLFQPAKGFHRLANKLPQGRPVLPVRGQGLHHCFAPATGHLRPHPVRGPEVAPRGSSRQQLVQHRAQGIHVRTLVHVPGSFLLFWRHVVGRAGTRKNRLQALRVESATDAKIQHAHLEARADHHVLGLEIEVYDFLAVRVL